MKFDMSEAWSDAIEMFRSNFGQLMVLALIFVFLPSIIVGFAIPASTMSFADLGSMDDPQRTQEMLAGFLGGFAILWLGLLVVQLVGQMAMTATADGGRSLSLGDAISIGIRALPTMLGVFVIAIVGYFLLALVLALIFVTVIGGAAAGGSGIGGFGALFVFLVIALIVALLYIGTRFSMILPAIVLGGERNPFKAYGQSWALTAASAWRILAYFVLLIIAYFVISLVLGLIVGLVALGSGGLADGGASMSAGMIIAMAFNALLSSVVAALMVTIIVGIYRQLAGPGAEETAQTFD